MDTFTFLNEYKIYSFFWEKNRGCDFGQPVVPPWFKSVWLLLLGSVLLGGLGLCLQVEDATNDEVLDMTGGL